MTRCSSRNAQASVTALSPRQRASNPERRGRVREVLRVAGLVEQRAPVVDSPDRLDAQDDATGDVDGRAERPRILARTRLEVEMDVALRSQVDAELRQRRLERCKHPLGGKTAVPAVRPQQTRDVRAPRLVEPDPEPGPEQSIEGAGVQALRLGEEALALLPQPREAEAESLVERAVGAAAQLGGGRMGALEHLAVGRVQLLRQVDARPLELLPALAVGLVRDRWTQLSVADGAAGHVRLERRLETRDALFVGRVEAAEHPFAGEPPQLGQALLRRIPLERARAARRTPQATSGRHGDRRSARGRAPPSGRRTGGSTPPGARTRTALLPRGIRPGRGP